MLVRYFESGLPVPFISPNGKYFLFVTTHGKLSCDCNIDTLSVFSAQRVLDALKKGTSSSSLLHPFRVITRQSSGLSPFGIFSPQWDSNGTSVYFIGADKRGIEQYYAFDVRSGKFASLTNWTHAPDLGTWPAQANHTSIADFSVPKRNTIVYPVHVMTADDINDTRNFPGEVSTRMATLVFYRGKPAWELTGSSSILTPWLSPNGNRAVAWRRPNIISPSWRFYDNSSGFSDAFENIGQFIVIDVEHRRVEPVFNAPTGLATKMGEGLARSILPQALWAQDQKHVILVNTALPLVPGKPERLHTAYIVGLNTDTHRWAVIEPCQSTDVQGVSHSISQVGWLMPGKDLFVGHTTAGKPAPGMVYTLVGDRWVSHQVDATVKLPQPSLPEGLSVKLQQNDNSPPIAVASDGYHHLTLIDADPALRGLSLVPTQPFQWKEPSGKTVTGGLLLPRDVKQGPVPLVIQVYHYEPDVFHPDGPDNFTYAAQSLVARGIAVLNVELTAATPGVGKKDGPPFVDRVDSAVDALVSRGFIDRNRIGLIGFSRGGYEVSYVVTHPGKNPAAAAVIDDAFDGSYGLALMESAVGFTNDVEFQIDPLYGGPFWQNKAAWLAGEPTFNMDRVQTPVIETIHREDTILNDLIGAYRANHRPLEFLVYPQGLHVLRMPRQRLASYEASVDWMAYWLKGEIPPNKATAARWAKMRIEQQAVLDQLKASGKAVTPLPQLVPAPAWAIEAHS